MGIGDAFLSALLQLALEKLVSQEVIKVAFRWNFSDQLENLRMILPKIQAVLNDAEEKQLTIFSVKSWLDDLKHVAYDVEDVLDEIATEALRQKVEEESSNYTNQHKVWKNRFPNFLNVVTFGFGISSKIMEITERLEKIAKYMDVLGLKEGVGMAFLGGGFKQRVPTSSLVKQSCVYGREKDKEKIIELVLLDECGENEVSVISIVGMGGLGKTTLAQLVYNDERVCCHFDMKAWVCVSEKFDVLRLTKAILESVSGTRCDFEQLDLVQVKLEHNLRGKRFLFVLDDVWNENYSDWDLLKAPFTVGAHGSTIIVTTRNENVALIVGTIHAYRLQVLSNEDCCSLFTQHAFADRNPTAHPNLVVIGKEIVKKCQGLPLTAKMLGGLLRSKMDVDEWEDILNSEMWDLPEDKCEIIPSLRLSYHHLPSHLKLCFAYCSIFPKGYEFVKEELVLLWMAEGFVRQKGRKQMEDMAREYFDDLCLRSFFEQSHHDKSLFTMHDLLNDLAVSISGEVSFRLESYKSCIISEKARHSSYLCGLQYGNITKFEAFYEAKSLRTFLPLTFSSASCYFPNKFAHDLFSTLRCLRVLCLKGCDIKDLPDSISNLKHLRYLDLTDTLIERLPESITTLFNLQTLLLIGCDRFIEFPKDLGNLINLRHLDTSMCFELKKTPPGIGRLKNLQTLSNFVVGENDSPGCGIAELRDMFHLRGSLCISNLKNVVKVRDAMESNLKGKHFSSLQLNWNYFHKDYHFDDSRDEKIDEDVLDRLQPNSDLKELIVSFYSGSRFPSWIGDQSFSNLEIVSLTNCTKCRFLPPLGQLPVLKKLYIDDIHGVKSVGHELYGDGLLVKQFCSLETLTFRNMLNWDEWSRVEGEEEFPRLRELTIERCPKLKKFSHRFPVLVNLVISNCEGLTGLPKHPSSLINTKLEKGGDEFPCLRELGIWNCPMLRELPLLFPSLVDLQILNCHELAALPKLPCIKKLHLSKCNKIILIQVSDLTSLSSLCISSILNLHHLPGGFLQHLAALEELKIINCTELMVLQNDVGLQHLASLRRLVISECPRLLALPQGLHHLTSLVELRIHKSMMLMSFPETGFHNGQLRVLSIVECEKLESLPKGLHNLRSLQELEIEGCHGLTSFPEMEFPPLLRRLHIIQCNNFLSLPEQFQEITSLEYLKIKGCSRLTSFSRGGLIRFPTSLKHIEIIDCKNLESLPQGLHNLTYLKDLTIALCPLLVSFQEGPLPATLTFLCIEGCENLESLPKGLHNLTSLQTLKISNCPKLKSLPEEGLPKMLHHLFIDFCPQLTQQCQTKKGED